MISTRDTVLAAVPLLLMVMTYGFRIDQLFAAPKGWATRPRPICGIDEHGEPILCDPDGHRVDNPHRARKTGEEGKPQGSVHGHAEGAQAKSAPVQR